MRENWIYFQTVPAMQYQRPRPPADPLVNSMYQIDGDMRAILNRQDLNEEEKLLLYDEKLRTYLNRYDKYRHPMPSNSIISVSDKKQESTNPDSFQQILESVPKQVQSHSKLFLEKLKDVVTWNEKGEISFKGQPPVKGSNIIDLLGTAVRSQSLRSVSTSPPGMDTFIRGMKEANIPHTWIRNRTIINRMQQEQPYEDFSTPPELLFREEDSSIPLPQKRVSKGGFGTPSLPRKISKWEKY